MKKRMFAILLTAAMVMTSLSGCKSSDSGDSKKTTAAEESTLSDTRGGDVPDAGADHGTCRSG